MKHLLFTMTYLLFSLSILAAEDNNDPSLIFKVTFDGYTVTADKASGYKKSPPDEAGHFGVPKVLRFARSGHG